MLINRNMTKTLEKFEIDKIKINSINVLMIAQVTIQQTLKNSYTNGIINKETLEEYSTYNNDYLIDKIENNNRLFEKILDDLKNIGIDTYTLGDCSKEVSNAISKTLRDIKLEEIYIKIDVEEFIKNYENTLNNNFYNSNLENALQQIDESLDNTYVIDKGLDYFNINTIYIEETEHNQGRDYKIRKSLEECLDDENITIYKMDKDNKNKPTLNIEYSWHLINREINKDGIMTSLEEIKVDRKINEENIEENEIEKEDEEIIF